MNMSPFSQGHSHDPSESVSSETFHIRPLHAHDLHFLVHAFKENNLPKPLSTFEKYLRQHHAEERFTWVALAHQELAGYVTLQWRSHYPPFLEGKIPEIMDLNVLPPYRGRGIGAQLLETAERMAFAHRSVVGIGVGLYGDYGSAQRLYIAHGYVPDGRGVTYAYEYVEPGAPVRLDDDLLLWLTKERP